MLEASLSEIVTPEESLTLGPLPLLFLEEGALLLGQVLLDLDFVVGDVQDVVRIFQDVSCRDVELDWLIQALQQIRDDFVFLLDLVLVPIL